MGRLRLETTLRQWDETLGSNGAEGAHPHGGFVLDRDERRPRGGRNVIGV